MDIIKTLLKLALFGSQWVMWLLLALSVLSISAMVERWMFFRTADADIDELTEKLCAFVESGDEGGARAFLEQRNSIESLVLARAIKWLKGGADSLADAIEGEMTRRRKELERGMNLLGTLGNNAPFIGLLGTVIGVIQAFNQLGAGQDKAAMGNVMAGIAEALVATGVGLFVAIPAVVAYNFFQKRVADVDDNVSGVAKQLGAILRATPRAQSATRPASEVEATKAVAVELPRVATDDPGLAS